MRRICSFHGFFLSDLYAPVGRWDFHGFTLVCGLSADFSCYMQSSAVQAQIQSVVDPISSGYTRLNEIREKDKIRRIRFIRDRF